MVSAGVRGVWTVGCCTTDAEKFRETVNDRSRHSGASPRAGDSADGG